MNKFRGQSFRVWNSSYSSRRSFSYMLDPTKVESLDDNDQVLIRLLSGFWWWPWNIPTQATLVIIIDGLNSPPTLLTILFLCMKMCLSTFIRKNRYWKQRTDPENNPLSLVAINSNSVSPMGGSFGEFSWTNEAYINTTSKVDSIIFPRGNRKCTIWLYCFRWRSEQYRCVVSYH